MCETIKGALRNNEGARWFVFFSFVYSHWFLVPVDVMYSHKERNTCFLCWLYYYGLGYKQKKTCKKI